MISDGSIKSLILPSISIAIPIACISIRVLRAAVINELSGDKRNKEITSYRLISPNRKGRVFLDRLTFPVKKINDRTTPDLQMPYNNSLSYRDLWHWCRVWQWEQYDYDLPLPNSLNQKEREELRTIEQRLTAALDIKKAPVAIRN